MSHQPASRLHRALGVPGAVIVGLSAMLGTGVFAVWSPAWDLAGSWLLAALVLAGAVATLNAISTARLARRHPESGGAYAYGRIRLGRGAGVLAGLAFLVGKSASAAAAALTIGVYVWPGQERWIAWLAIALALIIDLRGIVRSTRVNAVLVAVLIVIVAVTIGWGVLHLPSAMPVAMPPASGLGVLAAAGLLFVAFAGYARITVLGEEVRDPSRTIPFAMAVSFAIVILLYLAVAWVVMAWSTRGVTLGPAALESIVSNSPTMRTLVMLGAVLGAGSVLINLVAGMGRTLFAMASRGDAPRALAEVSRQRVPQRAAITAAIAAAIVVVPGRLAWALTLSGGSILVYYSVAHAASFTVPGGFVLRRVVPVLGLLLCVVVVLALVLVSFSR